MLSLIKAGSVIERVYFTVPETYGPGNEYATFVEAGRAATQRRNEVYEQVFASHPEIRDERAKRTLAAKAADVKAVVDLRWVIKQPDGNSTDTVVERTNVAHLDMAHWDKCDERVTV